MDCRNLKCSTILVNLNSAVTITKASILIIVDVHDESRAEQPDDDSKDWTIIHEDIDDEPYLETQHEDCSRNVEDSDQQ